MPKRGVLRPLEISVDLPMSGSGPFDIRTGSGKQRAPAVARNQDAILAALRMELPAAASVLEVASGTGEHAVHFARQLPQLTWQPSDPDDAALASISAWVRDADLLNLKNPVRLDAAAQQWPSLPVDAIFCANMVHIAPWAAAVGLFSGAGRLLSSGAPLILYGPFLEPSTPTAPSNLAFDSDLRARNAAWGLRDVMALEELASGAGLMMAARHIMPANNLILVWRKRTE